MNEKYFLEKYLWPSGDRLDRAFTLRLPDIKGLKNCGDFIVQCEHEDTFSTNILTKYESETLGIRLIELYKNTQNKVSGLFVRLVGTMNIVKIGYPRVSLDAPVSNVNLFTQQRSDITTRTFVSLPQATPEQSRIFFEQLTKDARAAGISFQERHLDFLPAFWGSTFQAESDGANLDMIHKLRDGAWNAYNLVLDRTKGKANFDYRPIQENIIFASSGREHLMFQKMGLSVPVEAQAAFFSVMVAGL